jgi:hypothetical protein
MFYGTACVNRWCLFVSIGDARTCSRCLRRERYYRLKWYTRLDGYGLLNTWLAKGQLP